MLDAKRYNEALKQFETVVALDPQQDRVLGLQDVIPHPAPASAHIGEISTFVALSNHRGGIGRRMCQASFADAHSRGYVKLMASIRADNSSAIAFYEAQGFQVIGTSRGHARVGDRYIDAVFAECMLDEVLT